MNIVDLLRGEDIEGISRGDLWKILSYSHPGIRIRSNSNGVIVLSDRKIIKCVHHYYRNPDKEPRKLFGSNQCHIIHNNLEIVGESPNDCRSCHLNCLNKLEAGQLVRNIKKSSAKRRK